MKLTIILWILVVIVYIAGGILAVFQPSEVQEIDTPQEPPPLQPPDPDPVDPSPTTIDPDPRPDPQHPPSTQGAMQITEFHFDKDRKIIDISFLVTGFQAHALVTLPDLEYECVPVENVEINVEGLEELFKDRPVNLDFYLEQLQTPEIQEALKDAAKECNPIIHDEQAGATYIYGFAEHITTKRKGRIVEELTFRGIKDINFRGDQIQEEIRIQNQIVVPPDLDPGTYLMNITVIDKLTGAQDSVIKEFEV
ncbi:MAG: hypothetical protein ABIH34_03340 [Nanoarchaeota archaeon]